MALEFPNAPSDNDTVELNGTTFRYNATNNVWDPVTEELTATSDNPPGSPNNGQTWFDTTTGTLYVYYDDGTSSQWIGVTGPEGEVGPGVRWLEVTSNYSIYLDGIRNLLVDTSSSAITVTLPSGPSLGDEVRIIDGSGNAATNNITVARNGEKIDGVDDDLLMDYARAGIHLVYYNSTNGWVLAEN